MIYFKLIHTSDILPYTTNNSLVELKSRTYIWYKFVFESQAESWIAKLAQTFSQIYITKYFDLSKDYIPRLWIKSMPILLIKRS